MPAFVAMRLTHVARTSHAAPHRYASCCACVPASASVPRRSSRSDSPLLRGAPARTSKCERSHGSCSPRPVTALRSTSNTRAPLGPQTYDPVMTPPRLFDWHRATRNAIETSQLQTPCRTTALQRGSEARSPIARGRWSARPPDLPSTNNPIKARPFLANREPHPSSRKPEQPVHRGQACVLESRRCTVRIDPSATVTIRKSGH